MKVVFETNSVLPKLTQVASVINSKNNISILADICVTVNAENMILTASDGELWVTERVSILSNETPTVFCVPAQDIIRCLGSLKDETVTMTMDEEKKIIVCDYGNGNISMPYESADEYPKPMMDMDEANEVIISSNDVREAIDKTQTAIANDELRPIMNGIFFDFVGDEMTCFSCNFLKMVKYRKKINGEVSGHVSFTMPKKPSAILLSILSDIDESVKIRFTDKAFSVSNRDFKVTARLLEGDYPDCNRIIPKASSVVVSVEKNVLLQALRHVLSVENSGNLVNINITGSKLTVSADNFNMNKAATETIECVNNNSEDFSICFNGVVLSEMLKNINVDSFVFEMTSPKSPAILYAKNGIPKDEYLSLIMPMVQNNNSSEQ